MNSSEGGPQKKTLFERNKTSCYSPPRKKVKVWLSMRLSSLSSPSSSLQSCAYSDPRSAIPSAPSTAPCRNLLTRATEKAPSFDGALFLFIRILWSLAFLSFLWKNYPKFRGGTRIQNFFERDLLCYSVPKKKARVWSSMRLFFRLSPSL